MANTGPPVERPPITAENYEERRRALRMRFRLLKRGAQQAACYETMIPATLVARALNHAHPQNFTHIRKLEDWYDEFSDEYTYDDD